MIVIIDQETLQVFTHPGLDLLTGKVIELEVEPPRQLELFADYSNERRRRPCSDPDSPRLNSLCAWTTLRNGAD